MILGPLLFILDVSGAIGGKEEITRFMGYIAFIAFAVGAYCLSHGY